jgi:LytS/YehU family sensor histidine kinase
VGGRDAQVRVPVIDPPGYYLTIGPLRGGRRLLSDDQTLLEGVARLAARRIDGVRVARERFARDIRERDMQQLATEAELRALRAQLNPHFLFNALTTIGYLVRAAPDRAIETLLRLTDVLRAVLKRSDGEFATLGEEMEIVSAYLAIERARFEDRLVVAIDVPDTLAALRVPPLVLQPLIENAVKHGIAPLVTGGRISVTARLEAADAGGSGQPEGHWLRLTVTDTGMGADPAELARRRRTGIGLTNIERRLERHYGTDASIEVRTALGVGTTVDVRLPATLGAAARPSAPPRAPSLTS